MKCFQRLGFLVVACLFPLMACGWQAVAPESESLPTEAEVKQLLQTEPLTLESWPRWRARLQDWIHDRSFATDAAFEAARAFIKTQVTPEGMLPAELSDDFFAWYTLSRIQLEDGRDPAKLADAKQKAEVSLRRSEQLNPNFARTYRGLAIIHLLNGQGEDADKAMQKMRRLDPKISFHEVRGLAATFQHDFVTVEEEFGAALKEEPQDEHLAIQVAAAIVSQSNRQKSYSPAIDALVQAFPNSGKLACFHGLALAQDGNVRAGLREFERARQLGTDPKEIFGPKLVEQLEAAASLSIFELAAIVAAGFVALYAIVMISMAIVGCVLAGFTRGSRALTLLGGDYMQGGEVMQTSGESWLGMLYGLSLCAGLILFYISIPFVIAGILAATGALLLLIFQANRIPVKLVLIIVLIGFGMAWSVLKSLFASMGSGSYGMRKTRNDCPRLFDVLTEVADRVQTRPVDEVYLVPDCSISVHQDGRGPFGILGVKRRVLTLGVAPLRDLTTTELKSILAHEYAHFSHKDTLYSRFIHQVTLSIESSLMGMAESAGKLNYVNPFYWFLYLYYRAYSILSAGYSRSREYLADRMAAGCYGSQAFASALKKVVVNSELFYKPAWELTVEGLQKEAPITNVYEAVEQHIEANVSREELSKLTETINDQQGTLFASHPTYAERVEAISTIVDNGYPDSSAAIDIFEDPAAIEQEMTEFLTAQVSNAIYAQMQFEAQAANG